MNKKEYYLINRERIRARQKEYCLRNKEKRKQYLLDNKEKISEKHREYRLNNREKIKEKKANLKKVYWVTKFPKHSKRYGFKESEHILMEYSEEESKENISAFSKKEENHG